MGSGSSRFVGYPSWPRLLDELRERVVPELPFPADLDLLQKASFIRNGLEGFDNRRDRQRQYRQYLEATFRPRADTPNHAPFHRTLVQFPFCGVASTNYDPVIESAISSLRFQKGLDSECYAIDLCGNKPHRVFEFLRSLTDDGDPSAVLHIHGYWENADDLILTLENYKIRYGLPDPREDAADGALALPVRALDSLHRKVVWSLLTMRAVVFVGFSVQDPAFTLMLEFVHEDFDLPPQPPAHFALLPSHEDDQEERDARFLGRFGVQPVFYRVITDAAGNENHDALPALIDEIGAALGIASRSPAVESITRRMLER